MLLLSTDITIWMRSIILLRSTGHAIWCDKLRNTFSNNTGDKLIRIVMIPLTTMVHKGANINGPMSTIMTMMKMTTKEEIQVAPLCVILRTFIFYIKLSIIRTRSFVKYLLEKKWFHWKSLVRASGSSYYKLFNCPWSSTLSTLIYVVGGLCDS